MDLSLEKSLVLSEIENALGVKATYFLNLHSDFYNVLARPEIELINAIRDHGHEFGIHFDASFYKLRTETDLSEALEKQVEIFKTFFSFELSAFSFTTQLNRIFF